MSATVRPDELVGENGSGKSTLPRLAVGQEHPDDGEIIVSTPDGIGHLGQILDLLAQATVDAAPANIRE